MRANVPPIPGDPDADPGDAHGRLAETNRALNEQLRSAEQSAYLHALRAAYLQGEVHLRDGQIRLIRKSTSWRLTGPVRAPVHLAAALVRDGPLNVARRLGHVLQYQVLRVRHRVSRLGAARIAGNAANAADAAYTGPPERPAAAVVAPRVLLIAELSIPQCAKYRVWQRQEALLRLGTPCTVVDWRHTAECRSALQTHALAIFYRVPAQPDVVELLGEARRLGITTYWEVDDLIFDMPTYLANRNLDTIDAELRSLVLSGVQDYRAGLLACDRAIASTSALAEAMREAGADDVMVIENALDDDTMALAAASRARRAVADAGNAREGIVIGYGSGSKAHDADFRQASAAVAALMRARPDVKLRIMGELTLTPEIEAFDERVERLAPTGYAAYLDHLASCDISLAPLEATRFNDAKSNIKYVEAAILGLPSVCSPCQTFREVISDGQDGFLARDVAEWLAALTALAGSAALRRQVGEAARARVLACYSPEAVARTQVAPLVDRLDQRVRKPLRVLAVNVFFWPQTFGGATIVAEELARRLNRRADTEVFVFSSQAQLTDPPHTLLRYPDPAGGDMPIIGVRLPHNGHDAVLAFDNPEMQKRFNDVLSAVQPDVVHFHCVQGISASILQACDDRGVPFVVTVHDAWWLCQRQFMVRDGKYCGQTRIDLRVCEACIPEAIHLRQRFTILQQRLSGAARLLFPSEFHRQLHLANGAVAARALLNRNGVRVPERPRSPRAPGVLRFGYVGGYDRVKGIHLIQRAFETLERSDYELRLVDNTLNLGFRSMHVEGWKLSGKVTIVPAYRQETMDAFFEGIDVLLFPSQWKESFGLTVREALLRDVWVIATDGGGTVEDIVDGVNGTIIPLDDNHENLRDAVLALLDRPDRLAGYRNLYKDRIVTYDAQAEELHGILRDVQRQHVSEPETHHAY